MGDARRLIRKLATSKKVAAANRTVADKLAAAAKSFDPDGDFEVTDTKLTVNGLERNVSLVTNKAEDAARTEFGDRVTDGVRRPLGRASRAIDTGKRRRR